MNGHRVKLLFLNYLPLTGSIGYSQTGKVVGYIRSTRHQLTETVSFANVGITNANRSCPANLDGYYCIDSVPTGIQEIVATHVCCGVVSRKIEIIANKTLEVNLEFTCQFEKSEKDKTCPVCGKTDRVVRTAWGRQVVDYYGGDTARMKAKTVDTSYYYVQDQSPPCHPNWHCNRDHIEF